MIPILKSFDMFINQWLRILWQDSQFWSLSGSSLELWPSEPLHWKTEWASLDDWIKQGGSCFW